MPAAAAAKILGRAAEAQGTDQRVTDQIASVQDLLADDLRWIRNPTPCTERRSMTGEAPRLRSPPWRHLVTRGGKRVRPMALMLSARLSFGRRDPCRATRDGAGL